METFAHEKNSLPWADNSSCGLLWAKAFISWATNSSIQSAYKALMISVYGKLDSTHKSTRSTQRNLSDKHPHIGFCSLVRRFVQIFGVQCLGDWLCVRCRKIDGEGKLAHSKHRLFPLHGKFILSLYSERLAVQT